ncbi:Uncharacterised protein r2_g3875 [Pycnogonum litorale]
MSSSIKSVFSDFKYDQDVIKGGNNEEPSRGSWRRSTEYVLSCLGLTVGLGNFWRFPYVCYKNGGGSFLIPYMVMLFFLGMPLFFLEAAIGQYSAKGPAALFKNICPLFSGLGYTIVLTSYMQTVVYAMVIGWTFFYFFDSFRGDVRWKSCGHEFNTEGCFSSYEYQVCKQDVGSAYSRHVCYNSTYAQRYNISDAPIEQRISPAHEYFNLFVLKKTAGIGEFNGIDWHLLVCLLAVWTIVCFCCIKGVKSFGKVVYFTATFPYFALLILLIRGFTLEGAFDGIAHFLSPDWKKMITVSVWHEAAIQIFYSTSVASGGIITLSSYNKFQNNIVRDTLVVTVVNSVTSFLSGLAVFAVIGYMADSMGLPIDEVVEKGPSLAFVTYADAIAKIPVSPAWAILFFLMLITLSIDSVFAMIENVATAICDDNPHLRSRKWLIVIVVCLFGFILGIPLTTGTGIYVVELVLNYLARPMIFLGIMECVVVAYFYGIEEFMEDVEEMVGWKPSIWVKTHTQVVLLTVAPFVLSMMLLMILIDPRPFTNGTYTYPQWANAIGWIISLVPVLTLITITVYKILFTHRTLTVEKRMEILMSPNPNWRQEAIKTTQDVESEQTEEEQHFT